MAIDCMPIFQNIYNFICIYNFDDWPLIGGGGGVYAGSTPLESAHDSKKS